MRKVFFTLLVFCGFVCFGDRAFCATKKTSRARVRSGRSVSVKNVSGNVKSNKFSGVVSEAYKQKTSSVMACGVPANVTDGQAKRLCAVAVADAMKLYCQSYSCQSKLKVELSFNFSLPKLSDVSVDVFGAGCKGKDLNTFCTPFMSELLDGLWDLYSEKNIRERKNCNMAMAKYAVAQDCFQYIEAEKNQSVGGIFSASKISGLDEGIDERCGRDAIIKKYKAIALDDLSEDDLKKYLGMGKISADGTVDFDGEGFQGKKKLSSTVASLFANVGDNTWNYVGQIGKLADLKLNMKSNTYPRELVTIANTFVTDGETACGKNFASDMENTSFELVDNRSSLERAVAKKGLLKGAFDFVVKNTVGVISEEKADKIIAGGLMGDKSNKVIYPEAEEDKKILSSCSPNSGYEKVTSDVKKALDHIEKAVNELYKQIKYKDELLKNDKNKMMISNLKLILKYAMNERPSDLDDLTDTVPTIEKMKSVVEKLKTVKQFNCEGLGFVTTEKVEFNFKFEEGDSIDAIAEALLNAKDGFEESLGKANNEIEKKEMTADNKNDFDAYLGELNKMKEEKSAE